MTNPGDRSRSFLTEFLRAGKQGVSTITPRKRRYCTERKTTPILVPILREPAFDDRGHGYAVVHHDQVDAGLQVPMRTVLLACMLDRMADLREKCEPLPSHPVVGAAVT